MSYKSYDHTYIHFYVFSWLCESGGRCICSLWNYIFHFFEVFLQYFTIVFKSNFELFLFPAVPPSLVLSADLRSLLSL